MRVKDIRQALQSVVVEYRVATAAVDQLHFSIVDDPTRLRRFAFDRAAIRGCARRLEITYLLRMFAVFEGGLRSVWLNAIAKTTEPPMEHLLDALAARLHVRVDTLDQAHAVRDYRNDLIHEGLQIARIPLATCQRHLEQFLSEIPLQW